MNSLRLLLFLILCLSVWTAPARSWDPSELPAGFTVAAEGYPVQLEGKTLLTVRVNHKKYPAPQRADKFSAEILKLAQDPSFDPSAITVQDFDLSSDIIAGNTVIMPVWAFEAKVEGRPVEELARDYAGRIRQAIAGYKQEHRLSNFLISIAKTLAALLLLIVLIILVNRGGRRLQQIIRETPKIHSVRFGEAEFLRADRIKALINSAVQVVRLLIILFLFYAYLHLGLSFFPTTKQFAMNFYHNLINALSVIGHAIWEQIPSLTFLAVLYVIARYILKSLRFFFDQVTSGTLAVAGLDAEVAPITYRIFRILIIIFFLVIAYPYIPGSHSPAFKGISFFLGVLLSFGSSSAVANLMAGVALTYQRPYRVGDVIKVGDIVGVVLDRKLNVTLINTWKNQIVTMSNNTVFSGYVTNFSQKVREGNGVILHTSITIGYDAPWRTVYALLIEAARATRHILPTPPPFVFQSSLNDFYVSYELNAYKDSPENMLSIYSELHENIQDKFNEGGVEIMSPHYYNLRDGNQTTIPADYLPPDYIAPGLRIANIENPVEK